MQMKTAIGSSLVSVTATSAAKSKYMSILIARVETIKAMDISALSSSERKELRNELRAIKSDLKERNKSDLKSIDGGGTIYLSVGAIIVIILLLILLL